MRIAFLVPDGVGIRNYLYSNVLPALQHHDIIIIHDLPPQVIENVARLHSTQFEECELIRFKDSRFNSFLRKVCNFGRIHLNAKSSGNKTIGENYFFYYHQKGFRKLFFRFHDLIGKIFGSTHKRLQKLEDWLSLSMQKSSSGKIANALLDEINADLIFCTHQRSLDAAYIINAANSRGIRTISVIFSWDNLPKNRIAYKANEYFVWSRYMQKEMQLYYPNIGKNQLIITGTPQFEVYNNRTLYWPRQKFDAYFNVPPGREAICFSGNDTSFPSDHLYLQDMLEEMQTMPENKRPFIIVRPSPVDHTGRFDEVVAKYKKDAAVHAPLWFLDPRGGWGSYLPTPEDGEILTNLGVHCAAVINIGSTMAIDFAHFDKPAIYVRYNHPGCAGYNLLLLYKQEHLKPLDTMDAVVWVKEKTSWNKVLYDVLHSPDIIATERQKFRQMITDDILDASARIGRAITHQNLQPALSSEN